MLPFRDGPAVAVKEAIEAVLREDLVFLEVITPVLGVGSSHDFDLTPKTFDGRDAPFRLLHITGFTISSPDLTAPGDTVTLRLYYRAERREPRDIAAHFVATSDIAWMFSAGVSNRRIEVPDLDGKGQVHGRLTNMAGNSARASLTLVLFARRAVR